MKKNIFTFSLIICLFACQSKEQEDCLILKVQLEDKGVSFHDLFERLELIPLETNDNSLIKQIADLYSINDTLFVFDRSLKSLYTFDALTGKHLNTIMKVGQGPGEYLYVADALIDTLGKTIKLLSAMPDFISTYSYSGQFIERFELPSKPPNAYSKIMEFDNETYLVWAFVDESRFNLGNISFISKQTHQILTSFWEPNGLEQYFVYFPFWKYNDKTCFSTVITNKVYQITKGGYHLVYQWDFGKYNVDKYRESNAFKVNDKNRNEKNEKIGLDFSTRDDLYYFARKLENKTFYYAQIVFKNNIKTSPHIFYNKETGYYHYFFKTIEGISFFTFLLKDNYIMGELSLENKDDLLKSNLLNDKDRLILDSMQEYDNPILIKLFFK